jgi:DNA polymerase-3 subunit epsilon
MAWHTRRLAAFDLETTGVDCESDRIVTASVSLVGGGLPVESHDWLADPGVEIPAGATAVHGITTEQARAEGRAPGEVVEEVTALLAGHLQEQVPVIVFNARFDLTCLDREARRHGVRPLIERVGREGMLVIDPFVLDKQVDRFRKGKRTLTAVCEHYRVQLGDAHVANADALAAARVAWRLAEAVAELREADLATLHGRQVAWAAEQAASLQEYFRGRGSDEQVECAWPIIPERMPQEITRIAA